MDDMGYNTISGFWRFLASNPVPWSHVFQENKPCHLFLPRLPRGRRVEQKSSLLMAKDCHWRRRANETDMLHRWVLSTWHNNDDDVMIWWTSLNFVSLMKSIINVCIYNSKDFSVFVRGKHFLEVIVPCLPKQETTHEWKVVRVKEE